MNTGTQALLDLMVKADHAMGLREHNTGPEGHMGPYDVLMDPDRPTQDPYGARTCPHGPILVRYGTIWGPYGSFIGPIIWAQFVRALIKQSHCLI